MPLGEVNWIAALLAAVAGYAIGAIWYTALSQTWMKAAGLTKERIHGDRGRPSLTPFVVAAIANIVIATMLYGILVHVGDPTPRRGMMSGLFIWIGFVITTLSVNYSYLMRSKRLIAIDGVHWLMNLMAQGAILGWFMA